MTDSYEAQSEGSQSEGVVGEDAGATKLASAAKNGIKMISEAE
jgi:hypothetical protein